MATGQQVILPSDATRFLDLLHPQGRFTFQTFGDKSKGQAYVFHGTFAENAERLSALNSRGVGVFVTVNETDLKGRRKENITRVRAVFVDLDGAPIEPVLNGPLPPHIVTETSPGRFHAYWLLEFLPLEHFSHVQKKLAEQFGGDPVVHDSPRVMRLPGFYHHKKAPFLSRIVQANSGRYSQDEFLKAFNIRLPERKLSPEPTRKISKPESVGLISGCIAAIGSAMEGTRNTILNANAFKIGRLIAAGVTDKITATTEILAAAAAVGIDDREATYTTNRAIKDGIQAGPYRIPAPPPRFPLGEQLPPTEARAELSSAIQNIINTAEEWKFLNAEIEQKIKSGMTPKLAKQAVIDAHSFTDLVHAPRDLVVATPGLGKTRATIETILESELDRVLIYLPTTALGMELAAKYPGKIKALRGRCDKNCSKAAACQEAGRQGIPVYESFCEMVVTDTETLIPKKIQCADFHGCAYLQQFQDTGEKIIVVSHEFLRLKSGLLKQLGPFDLHVIDETITGILTGQVNFSPLVLPSAFHGVQPGDDVKAHALKGGWGTLEKVENCKRCSAFQIELERRTIHQKLNPMLGHADALERLGKATTTGAFQRWRLFDAMAQQWEMAKGLEAITVGTKAVHVDGKSEMQTRVAVAVKRDHTIKESEPILLLDADGDIEVIKRLISPRTELHTIDAARNVFTIQVDTSASKTALGLPDEKASPLLDRLSKIVREIPGEKLAITYKAAEPLADFGDASVTHFGGFLGSNAYENCDIGILAGRNLPRCEDLELLARAIYRDDEEPLNLTGRYELQSQGYTMRDGSHRGGKVQGHPDSRVDKLLDTIRAKGSSQGLDRLRLVNNNPTPKLAIIMDKTPTTFPVDMLVSETGLQAIMATLKGINIHGGVMPIQVPAYVNLGVSKKQAEKVVKSIVSDPDSVVQNLPPLINKVLYGGEEAEHQKTCFQEVEINGVKYPAISSLPKLETKMRVTKLLGLNPIGEALDLSPTGVLILNARWLVQEFPQIFPSIGTAHKAIKTIDHPTGSFRATGKGHSRPTPFLARDDVTNPKEIIENMAGKELAFYSGPLPKKDTCTATSVVDLMLRVNWGHYPVNDDVDFSLYGTPCNEAEFLPQAVGW